MKKTFVILMLVAMLSGCTDFKSSAAPSESQQNPMASKAAIGRTATAVGAPDLIVTSVAMSPSAPAIGESVRFSAVIKNQGSGASPQGTIHGVGFLVDGQPVSWSDTHINSIPAGASVTVTANGGPTGAFTWTATSGTHAIQAFVDDVNRIKNESNETNNKLVINISVAAAVPKPVESLAPDLIVTSVAMSPSAPMVGESVRFSAVIKNQGSGASPLGTIHGVGFLVDGQPVSWSDTHINSIPAGASVTVTANGGPTGAFTWTATSGAHAIQAFVDDVNRIANESDETNNILALNVSVAGVSPAPTPISTPVPTGSSPELPFDLPTVQTLAASPYKVYAHWHWFPTRVNATTPDYYDLEWLKPAGEGGKHYSYGGFLRERPLYQAPAVSDYLKTDMKTDIEQASRIGIDGFFFNFWSGPGDPDYNNKLIPMLNAADELAALGNPFRIILNFDSSIMGAGADPNAFADIIGALKSRPSLLRTNGKLVLGAFRVEALPLSWYQTVFARLKNVYGVDVSFIPTFLNNTEANWNTYKPIMDAFSQWDHVDHNASGNLYSNYHSWGNNNGKPFMPAVMVRDDRPSSNISLETGGFKAQNAMWTAAINQNAKFVQLETWNDYSEGHQIKPSTGGQNAFYDLTAYYITWFKTRQQPAIVRDVLYYSHRMHPVAAQPDFSRQSRLFSWFNGVPGVDRVYMFGLFKASGTAQIISGGQPYTFSANAGVNMFEAPFAINDQPRFTFARSGATLINQTSAFRTRGSIVWQDLLYRAGGSSRSPVPGVQNNMPSDR